MWLYVPYTSAPATEAWNLPSDSPESTPEPSVMLSGKLTQRPLSWRGWRTRPWIRLLSGLTSPRSTVDRGVAEWISSLPASPASPSARPGNAVEWTMTVGSGRRSHVSSVRWNRASCSWRTFPALFEQDLPTSSVTLPPSGSMRSGVVSAQPQWAPPTSGSGSGSWPTPRAVDSKGDVYQVSAGRRYESLTGLSNQLMDRAKLWPTPTARDPKGSDLPNREGGSSLPVVSKMWPTLAGEAISHSGHLDPTTQTAGGSGSPKADLNPAFVESLMGLPVGWSDPLASVTDFTSWATAWSRRLRPLLSPISSIVPEGKAAA